MNCEYCQSPAHIWFQCPKKPDGWKPARLAKKSTATKVGATSNQRSSHGSSVVERGDAGRDSRRPQDAGSIPALPVDTNSSPRLLKDRTGIGLASSASPRDAEEANTKDAVKFDKKTWQRNYMRTYLRQYRADVKAGKRTPKPRA